MVLFIITKLLVSSLFLICAQSLIEFTNLKCTIADPKFSYFEYCSLKAVNRSYSYVTIKVKLLQLPVNDVTVVIALLKKANGYKPFLYNITLDGCKFLERSKNPVAKYMYSFIKDVSNINHTCPYDHDLVLDKFSNKRIESLLSALPMPSGEYAVFTQWSTGNVLRATVNGFVKFTSNVD